MTPEQITQWARESNMATPLYDYQKGQLQAFANLVRQHTLEEAAMVCESEYDNWDNERPLRLCANAIRSLKT